MTDLLEPKQIRRTRKTKSGMIDHTSGGLRSPKTFGEWVYIHRTALNMTQDELAQKITRSKSYVSSIERDESHSKYGHDPRPTPETVRLIADAFGVDPVEPLLMLGHAPQAYPAGTSVMIGDPIHDTLRIAGFDNLPNVRDTIETLHCEAQRYRGVAEQLERLANTLAESVPDSNLLRRQYAAVEA